MWTPDHREIRLLQTDLSRPSLFLPGPATRIIRQPLRSKLLEPMLKSLQRMLI